MFLRPNWRELKNYELFLEPDVGNFLAWEFLRRNPDYQQELEAIRGKGQIWKALNPDFRHADFDGWEHEEPDPDFVSAVSMWVFGLGNPQIVEGVFERWGLLQMLDPSRDSGGEEFPIDAYERPELFEPVRLLGAGPKGPKVMIPVDLSEPLEVLQGRVMWTIKRLRAEGIESGAIIPRTGRVLAPRVYVEQLRILDAVHGGATWGEIGEVLQPLAVNDPETRQRDKRIRAAHVAALKMQSGGYRVFLTNT